MLDLTLLSSMHFLFSWMLVTSYFSHWKRENHKICCFILWFTEHITLTFALSGWPCPASFHHHHLDGHQLWPCQYPVQCARSWISCYTKPTGKDVGLCQLILFWAAGFLDNVSIHVLIQFAYDVTALAL